MPNGALRFPQPPAVAVQPARPVAAHVQAAVRVAQAKLAAVVPRAAHVRLAVRAAQAKASPAPARPMVRAAVQPALARFAAPRVASHVQAVVQAARAKVSASPGAAHLRAAVRPSVVQRSHMGGDQGGARPILRGPDLSIFEYLRSRGLEHEMTDEKQAPAAGATGVAAIEDDQKHIGTAAADDDGASAAMVDDDDGGGAGGGSNSSAAAAASASGTSNPSATLAGPRASRARGSTFRARDSLEGVFRTYAYPIGGSSDRLGGGTGTYDVGAAVYDAKDGEIGRGTYSASTGVHAEMAALDQALANHGLAAIAKIRITKGSCRRCGVVLRILGLHDLVGPTEASPTYSGAYTIPDRVVTALRASSSHDIGTLLRVIATGTWW